MEQLFSKPPRRMKQPTKDQLREQLAKAADEIEQLRAAVASTWWRRALAVLRALFRSGPITPGDYPR